MIKLWDKIWAVLKYFGIIVASGGAIWKISVFFISMQSSIDDIKQTMADSLSEIRSVIINYQVETKTGFEAKTGQINEILEQLKVLGRNQKIIILKSNESHQIIEEIKNQQLIDGTVDIGIIESKDAYVVQLKKKELGL